MQEVVTDSQLMAVEERMASELDGFHDSDQVRMNGLGGDPVSNTRVHKAYNYYKVRMTLVREGGPYDRTNFVEPLYNVLTEEGMKHMVTLGTEGRANQWFACFTDKGTALRLLDSELVVNGHRVVCEDPAFMRYFARLYWLPAEYPDDGIYEYFSRPSLECIKIVHEHSNIRGLQSIRTGVRLVEFKASAGLMAAGLIPAKDLFPQFVDNQNVTSTPEVLISVKGRPPVCFKCNQSGHVARECPAFLPSRPRVNSNRGGGLPPNRRPPWKNTVVAFPWASGPVDLTVQERREAGEKEKEREEGGEWLKAHNKKRKGEMHREGREEKKKVATENRFSPLVDLEDTTQFPGLKDIAVPVEEVAALSIDNETCIMRPVSPEAGNLGKVTPLETVQTKSSEGEGMDLSQQSFVGSWAAEVESESERLMTPGTGKLVMDVEGEEGDEHNRLNDSFQSAASTASDEVEMSQTF